MNVMCRVGNFKILTTVYPCEKGNKGGEGRGVSVTVST